MSKFVIEEIVEIRGKQKFFKLLNNGKCEFEEFCKDCLKDPLMKKQLAQIVTRMGYIADLKYDRLDKTKFRELSGRDKNDAHKDYEIKTKHLRLYFFKDVNGQVVVLGGTKGEQGEDIKRMRAIKKEYFK